MNITELTRGQREELKQRFLMDKKGDVSYSEIFFIDDIVSDREIIEEYDGVNFVEEDFSEGSRHIELGDLELYISEKYRLHTSTSKLIENIVAFAFDHDFKGEDLTSFLNHTLIGWDNPLGIDEEVIERVVNR